ARGERDRPTASSLRESPVPMPITTRLVHAVETALRAARRRLDRKGERDIWVEISSADVRCLTGDNPARVAQAYRKALVDADEFVGEAAGEQLAMYEQLGVLTVNVRSALHVIGPSGQPTAVSRRLRVLLFTGHQVDRPGQPEPRFPPAKEGAARQAIREHVAR